MQDFDGVPFPADAREHALAPRAELLARQARAGLLWSPDDERLSERVQREPTDLIPCGVQECTLLDCMIQSTDEKAVRSRIRWVIDLDDHGEGNRLAAPVDFSETRFWPWEEMPRFRTEGAATFRNADETKAIIAEVVAACADEVLAWLGSGKGTIEVMHSFGEEPEGDEAICACKGIVWNPSTNVIREVVTNAFAVTLERASGPAYPMGMRVAFAPHCGVA